MANHRQVRKSKGNNFIYGEKEEVGRVCLESPLEESKCSALMVSHWLSLLLGKKFFLLPSGLVK